MNPVILIVDDEPSGREALESILLNQGYTLVFAAGGVEALAKAREFSPDMILLDVMMPVMDGYEVCRSLRADPRLAEVPVVMVTALDDRDSRIQGIEAGADDFITKPIDRAELRARVRTITRLNRYHNLLEERAKLERHLERLTALRTIDLAITSSVDLHVTLDVLLGQVAIQLGVDAAGVLALEPYTETLRYAAGRGFHLGGIEQAYLRLGRGYIGRAVMDRRMISIPDLSDGPADFERSDLMRNEHFQAYFAVPLLAKGQIKGVLEVFHRSTLAPDPTWLDFLETLGDQTAIAIDSAQLFAGLQRSNTELLLAYDATIEGWSRALDLRDKETEGHTQRVAEMTLQLARVMGISEPMLVHMRRGALLHDIGKLGVPDNILFKAGPLTPQEWAIMRQHPVYAYELLSPILYLRPALDIPYSHHEKWDGTGYPQGLMGEQIPLAARIFAVVDVWDALLSDRPYRQGWPKEKVCKYIEDEADKHFDPYVAEAFLRMIGDPQS
jgi:response regulator RpfG family c-di-GMP phosphodiesterase